MKKLLARRYVPDACFLTNCDPEPVMYPVINRHTGAEKWKPTT